MKGRGEAMEIKMTKQTNKNLEELCIYKRTCGDVEEDKSYCALSCDGYDKLCPDYFTLYDERLSRGFTEGGEDE